MNYVALCKACGPFKSEDRHALAPACPKCGEATYTDDGNMTALLKTFHYVFPTSIDPKRRKAMLALAEKLLRQETSVEEALEEASVSRKTNKRVLTALEIVGVWSLVFLGMIVWHAFCVTNNPGLENNREARADFFAQLFGVFQQVPPAPDDAELWPFFPKPAPTPVTLGPSGAPEAFQLRSQEETRSGTSAASKRVQRRGASQSKGKAKP